MPLLVVEATHRCVEALGGVAGSVLAGGLATAAFRVDHAPRAAKRVSRVEIELAARHKRRFRQPFAQPDVVLRRHEIELDRDPSGADPGLGQCIGEQVGGILGELVPKSLALQRAEQVALAVAAPMDVFLTLTRPLLFVMSRAAGWVLRIFGSRRIRQGPVHSPDELKLIVTASRSELKCAVSCAAARLRTRL